MVKKIEQLSATIIMSTIVKDFEVMRLGLKLTGVLTHIDFGGVGWLNDYRTSLSLKGERLFHTKIHDYLTMVRKKTLRLSLCDY